MPEKLGPYTLNRRIGVGGMADVFLAEGPRGVCVVKRPHPHLCANPDFLRMFLDEASLLARLHHPGIAQISDLGHVGSTYYLAMEYVRGFDLMTISLEHERHGELIAPELCARIIAEAADALHYAHEAKGSNGQPLHIIHRDVTPHNILLSTSGEVKLIDFGVAKATTTLHRTQAGFVKGKYAYMAPEQITGQYIDRRVDVYALGLVTYELLTNVRAIAGDTEVEQIDNARACRIRPIVQLRPNTPVPLQQIVASCLYPDPEGRYPTALALKEDLEKYLTYERHVVGREDLLRLFRVVAADMAHDAVPTDAELPGRPTELDSPVSAVIVPEGAAADGIEPLGMATTLPSMKHLSLPNDGSPNAKVEVPLALRETVREAPRKSRWPLIFVALAVVVAGAVGATEWLRRSALEGASSIDAGLTVADVAVDAGAAETDQPEAQDGAVNTLAGTPTDDRGSPFIDAGLVVSASVGTLKVSSEPRAQLTIDKRVIGVTPLTVELEVGTHDVTLAQAEPRMLWRTSVSVKSSEVRSLSHTFEKGRLIIEAQPFATVKVDGVPYGAFSYKEVEVYEGTHVIDFELSDPSIAKKVVKHQQVRVKPNESFKVHQSMMPE